MFEKYKIKRALCEAFNFYRKKSIAFGEYDRRCKLTKFDIKKIKMLYKKGVSSSELADMFGVSAPTIIMTVNPKVKEKRNEYNKNYNKNHYNKHKNHYDEIKKTYEYKKELVAKGLI